MSTSKTGKDATKPGILTRSSSNPSSEASAKGVLNSPKPTQVSSNELAMIISQMNNLSASLERLERHNKELDKHNKEMAKINKETNSTVNLLQAQLAAFDSRIKDNSTAITDLNKRFDVLDSKVEEVNASLENHGNSIRVCSSDKCFDDYEDERIERELRKNNVVLFNVNEESTSSGSSDLNLATSILQVISLISVIKVKRRGAPHSSVSSSKPRPLVVTLGSNEEVIRTLKNRKLLPESISVSADSTPDQINHLKSLSNSMQEHNTNHPDKPKTIKYINGKPRLVFSKNNLQSQQSKN